MQTLDEKGYQKRHAGSNRANQFPVYMSFTVTWLCLYCTFRHDPVVLLLRLLKNLFDGYLAFNRDFACGGVENRPGHARESRHILLELGGAIQSSDSFHAEHRLFLSYKSIHCSHLVSLFSVDDMLSNVSLIKPWIWGFASR